MDINNLKENDIVLAEIEWRSEGFAGICFSFKIVQRVQIEEVMKNSLRVSAPNPRDYSFSKKYIKKEDVIDKVKHGKNGDCCRDCRLAYTTCGWHKEEERMKKRLEIEAMDALFIPS